LIDTWNEKIAANQEIPVATIQASMEKRFLIKSSLNDLGRYNHVALQPIETQPRRSSSLSPSTSHSKQGYAYAASSQDPPLPTTSAQMQKMIADAITNDRQKRSRSPSYFNQPRSRDYSRDRSRDRNPERQDRERRQDSRYQRHRETTQNPRRDQARCDTSMPRSPREQGDRSPSSERKDSASSAQSKSRA
jgi:hypothetical protein